MLGCEPVEYSSVDTESGREWLHAYSVIETIKGVVVVVEFGEQIEWYYGRCWFSGYVWIVCVGVGVGAS